MVNRKIDGYMIKMVEAYRTFFTLFLIVIMMSTCTARVRKLSMWIDEHQVKAISKTFGLDFFIIEKGTIQFVVNGSDLIPSLPELPPDVDTVNLTWEAGDEKYTYFFDDLQSKNKTRLYNPLLSIPASGIIPRGPKIFQVSIPCTGKDEGVAHFVLGLEIIPHQHGKPMEIELELKKRCEKFETTNLCKMPCQNNGRCNQNGECECPQGYHGQFCEIDMCNPKCKNNGTCISPDMCLCLDGFFGSRCEKETFSALCTKPCRNGGLCVPVASQKSGICWCGTGFYGAACEYSHCVIPCQNEGLCVGTNECRCKVGSKGRQCEKLIDLTRSRRESEEKEKKRRKAEAKRKKCDKLRNEIQKRCVKTKRCKPKQSRISKICSRKSSRLRKCKKRQEKNLNKCLKKREKRIKRCEKRQNMYNKRCSKVHKLNNKIQ